MMIGNVDEMLLPGTPCWIDLGCTRLRSTQRFYAELFGWQYQLQPEIANGNYVFAYRDGIPVAGLYDEHPGRTSVWRLYLATDNARSVAVGLRGLGGQVLAGPITVGGLGTMVVARHPGGAAIGLWQPTGDWPFLTNEPGALGWIELSTRDGRGADRFFTALFGYTSRQIGDGRRFDYAVWSLDGQPMIGRIRIDHTVPADIPPHWMVHFTVDPDVGTDDTVRQAARLGGRVRVLPFDTEFGRIAVVDDPSGASISLIDPTDALERDFSIGSDDPYDE